MAVLNIKTEKLNEAPSQESTNLLSSATMATENPPTTCAAVAEPQAETKKSLDGTNPGRYMQGESAQSEFHPLVRVKPEPQCMDPQEEDVSQIHKSREETTNDLFTEITGVPKNTQPEQSEVQSVVQMKAEQGSERHGTPDESSVIDKGANLKQVEVPKFYENNITVVQLESLSVVDGIQESRTDEHLIQHANTNSTLVEKPVSKNDFNDNTSDGSSAVQQNLNDSVARTPVAEPNNAVDSGEPKSIGEEQQLATEVRIKSNPQTEQPSGDELDGIITPERPIYTRRSKRPVKTVASDESMRVKREPCEISDNIPDDFFDDLLENAEHLTEGLFVGSPDMIERPTSPTPVAPVQVNDESRNDATANNCADDSEHISNDFFDDLLVDIVEERSKRLANEAQEIKYSEQLKSIREKLRQLDEQEDECNESKDKSKNKAKKSKSKKKSRKRERRREDSSDVENGHKYKRKRVRTGSRENVNLPDEFPRDVAEFGKRLATMEESGNDCSFLLPQPIPIKSESDEDDSVLILREGSSLPNGSKNEDFRSFKKIKLNKFVNTNVPDEPLILTPTMKRQKGLERAVGTINNFLQGDSGSFCFTSTVRILPRSTSFLTQQHHEHRSPLHTVNNVLYNFSSNSTRFNLRDWGLEALPKAAAEVARGVGCDAKTVFSKLNASKKAMKFCAIKCESDDDDESVVETKSTFFTNAITQTDDVYLSAARRCNAHDIGIQTTPSCESIATQTTNSNDDLPLLNIMKGLNENQLIALHDFAELMLEPPINAMDMYRMRTRMQEIIKCSQLPSALPHCTTSGNQRSQPMQYIQPRESQFNLHGQHATFLAAPDGVMPNPTGPHYAQMQHAPAPFAASAARSSLRAYADPRLKKRNLPTPWPPK